MSPMVSATISSTSEKPELARRQAEKLVSEGYPILTGLIASGEGLAIAPLMERWGSIYVSTINKADELTGANCVPGVFRVNTWVALFAATGVILSAAYALWLYRRVVFGALEKESLKAMLDLSAREKLVLYPLIALTIFFGVYPAPILDATAASVDNLVNNYSAALQAAQSLALIAN